VEFFGQYYYELRPTHNNTVMQRYKPQMHTRPVSVEPTKLEMSKAEFNGSCLGHSCHISIDRLRLICLVLSPVRTHGT